MTISEENQRVLIVIEPESEKPLYQQIRDQVVEGIASGQLPPGSSLPSIRQLASDFGINLHTVNKAYDLLEQEGFVQLRRKTGAVIQPRHVLAADWEARLRTLLAEACAQNVSSEESLARSRRILDEFAEQREAQGSLQEAPLARQKAGIVDDDGI